MHYYFIVGALFGLYCLLLELLHVEKKFTALLPALTLMAIFIGMRDFSIGTDTLNYVTIYKYIPTLGEYLTHFEPGFHGNRMERGFFILLSIFKSLSLSAHLMLVLNAFISLTVLAYAYKKIAPNYYLAVFIYTVSIFFFSLEYNILRQGLATAFVVLALSLLIENRKLLYLFFIAIAASFHVIALLSLCVYPFKNFKWQRKYVVFAFLLLVAFSFIDVLEALIYQLRKVSIIFWRVFLYFQDDAENLKIISWLLLSTMGLLLACIYFVKDIRVKFPHIDVIISFVFLGMLGVLFTQQLSMLSLRLGYLFLAVEPILILALFSLVKNEYPKYIAIFILALLILAKNVFITAQFLSPYNY
ncbi:MAG: EpsG family protein [Colwellia sp.]|nr:EpsG family protein [Colwellia sp.]